MMKKKFNLFGTEYLVNYCDEIKEEHEDENQVTEGLCDSANQIISVAMKRLDGNPPNNFTIRKNTLHEFFHAILNEGQYIELSNDEPLVEWLARCMTSILDQGVLDDWHQWGLSQSLQDPQSETPFNGQEGNMSRKSLDV